MYVQIPIFSGYANIAICPGHGTTCYMIDDVQKNQNLYSEINAKSNTFLPFYENHHYILYPTAEGNLDDGILYFHSEELMKKYILGSLGTEYVTGRTLSITVSKEAAPDVKNPMVDEHEHSQEKLYSNVENIENSKKIIKNKNSKKIIKNKNSKKNKNNKTNKKISVTFNIPIRDATQHCLETSMNTVFDKKLPKTKKNINKKTTKKIHSLENSLEHNKFFVLSQNLEQEKTEKFSEKAKYIEEEQKNTR